MNTVLSYLITTTLMYGNLFFIVVNFHKVVDGSANAWIYALNILSLILLVQLSKRQSKS